MTCLMKILKVEPVVPHLIDRRTIEGYLSDFKFYREYHSAHDQHDIDSSSHSRNVELEEDRSR